MQRPGLGSGKGLSPGKDLKKVVRMSEACDIIPYKSDYGDSDIDYSDVPCEEKQETPDYIRSAALRNQCRPVELFADGNGKVDHNLSQDTLVPRMETLESCDECNVSVESQFVGNDANMIENSIGSSVLQSEKLEEVAVYKEDGCTNCQMLQLQYDELRKDREESKQQFNELKRHYELKAVECNAAVVSLQELKAELMRKSMHVGSLAFAVEGQVKEKSRWFQSINDLSEKLKVLRQEHAQLLQETQQSSTTCTSYISQMNASLQNAMKYYSSLRIEHEDLKIRFAEEAKERKDLYNKLIELKGNIRVFCRCRPLNAAEESEGAAVSIDFENANDGEIVVRGHLCSKKIFRFDCVFSPEEQQETVFQKTAPFATSVLDGYNVCIFAYGQTGTGKTFTMEGTENARGVNYRTLEELFRIVKERQGLYQYDITVSVLEVYNEQIHDLLSSEPQAGGAMKRLEVRQVAEGVHHVPGLAEARVGDMNEAWEVLQTGAKARAVGSTTANEHSSRSHCMTCVMVKGENLVTGECTKSKLWLIDLAGSERVAKTDAQGERLKEAQNINKSLSALGDVISALATKSPHIPFRNSKLTHLLQDSLSGDSKTLMFVQISPNEDDVGETLCSLNFASRVRGVELGAARKQVDVGELAKYKLMVGKAKQDSKNKDAQVKSMQDEMQTLETKNKSMELRIVELQDKVKDLESRLVVERKLARQHVDTKIALDHMQMQCQPTSIQDEPSSGHPLSDITGHHFQLSSMKRAFEENLSIREKENKPELVEEHIPYKARRVSLCNAAPPLQTKARRISLCNPVLQNPGIPPLSGRTSLAPRRNSLIPLHLARPAGAAPLSLDRIAENPSSFCSPLPGPARSKKVQSILRRSLQKKVIIRPPLAQGGAADKLRLSGGSGNGRKARRVPASNSRNAGRAPQPPLQQKAWISGTNSRASNY